MRIMEPVDATRIREYWKAINRRNPNRTFDDEPTDMALGEVDRWYVHAITPSEFDMLYHFPGPSWNEFTGGNNTILRSVEIIRERELHDRKEDTPKIDNIRELAKLVPFEGYMDRIVVVERDGRWYTIDGNHRAAAAILHHLETGEDVTITAFVGKTTDDLNW